MGHVTVDATADVADAPDTSSITALLINRGPDDLISLREAIITTNNSPNLGIPDQIDFNIPDIDPGHVYYQDDSVANSLSLVTATQQDDTSIPDFDPDYPGLEHSWFRIQPASALPAITEAVSIDGYTQPGASTKTLVNGNDAVLRIELDGSLTGLGDGLSINAGDKVTLHGLVINRFNNTGILLRNTNQHTIAGNFIGTDVTGTIDLGNTEDGIGIDNSDLNTIGGSTAASRNVISGNDINGMTLLNNSANNTIAGNFIGTNAPGTASLGNALEGIDIRSVNNSIGGTAEGEANVISGNSGNGIRISGIGAANNTFYGNVIGTDLSGTLALGNGGNGITIENNASDNVIGGIAPVQANTIAFMGSTGVQIKGTGGSGNTIRGNAIHSNGGLGLDLGSDGISDNDVGDGDTGPNGLQNFPVITLAQTNETDTLTVDGTLNSLSGTNFALDFFSTVGEDGEGATYLGSIAVSTDGSGNASFNSIIFTPVIVPNGAHITATATVTSGPETDNTSEFSTNFQAFTNNEPPTATITSASYTVDENTPLILHGTGLSVSDPDAGANGVEGTLLVGEGTLMVHPGTTGVSVNGSGTDTVVLSGDLSQINNLLTGNAGATIVYNALDVPSASTLLTLDINDLGHTGVGGDMSDSDDAILNITSENDAPIVTLPSVPAIYDEDDVSVLIDAAATVTDPDSSDFDTGSLTVSFISGGTINDRLAIRDQGVGPGNISLSGNNVRFGSSPVMIGTFSGGSGVGDPLIVDLNANANSSATQALIRNITYDHIPTTPPSQARRIIEFELTDGDGGPGIPVTQTVIFNVRAALWLNAKEDTDPSDTNLPHWLDGDVVRFGINSTFGETTTSGLFTQLFALFFDNSDQADLRAIHYVTRPITLGSNPNTFEVLPGDIIAALDKDGTLQSTNSLAADRKDIFVFRPDSPGIYTSGTFTMLLEKPVSKNIHALTLVEEDVTFGDGTLLTAGTFLLAHSNPDHENVFIYQASGVGPGTTSGTELPLLDGETLGFDDQVQGLELIEDVTMLGDQTIPAARLLMSLDKDNTIAGQAVSKHDIAILEVHGTEQGMGTSVTATLFFDGDNVALTENSETLDGITIARNHPIVAKAPSVTHANTLEDHQTTSGLVITPHMDDGPEVTHAYITDITGGTLYKHDGITPIHNGDFIAMTEGSAGLKFTPSLNRNAGGSFTVQAATASNTLALGVEPSTATITITPVGDTPTVTNATTNEDMQTTSGLVISRHPADGSEVTHFKITHIQGGTLYQNDGTTPINDGDFIDVSEGNSGLKFTPPSNLSGSGSFDVEASEDGISVAVQSGVVTATITITPVADTPSVTDSSTLEDTQTTTGLVISTNPVDGPEVTHFKITAITGGTLYQNDGITPIGSGNFILVAEGSAGLKFTPSLDATATGSFTVQASTSSSDTGLGGGLVNAAISVTPVNDDPVAHPGAPYDISEGEGVSLDASLTIDVDSAALTYTWDLDGDDSFDDAVGIAPFVSWAQLQSFNIIDGDQSYSIKVRVDDGEGGTNDAMGTINLANAAPTLTISGLAGQLYTLNLSASDPGDDTITGWVINWGDGTIDTVVGNPPSTTHIYNHTGFTYHILASATDEDGTFLQNELVVPSYNRDRVYRYEATTGDFLQAFANTDGIDDPIQAIMGPDGKLYLSGEKSDDILRYDASTGTFDRVFVTAGSGGIEEPSGMAFGPDGNLYVSSGATDEVLRYNGATGNFIDAFVSAGVGGLDSPYSLTFGPGGNLYVASFTDDNVLHYDGNDGTFLGIFVTSGDGGLNTPEQITFGPDGHLYVASFDTDNVLRYNGTTGEFIDAFVTTKLAGLDETTGLAFGPDGHLYVADYKDDLILRYDGTSGAPIDTYVAAKSGGLDKPIFITFLPQHQVTVNPNTLPTISLPSGALGYTENSPPAVLDAAATLSDPDSPDFDTGTLTVDLTSGGTVNDRLAIRDQGPGVGHITMSGINVHYDFGVGPILIGTVMGGTDGMDPLDVTFNANANVTSVEAVLRNATYQNISDDPSTATRMVRFVVTDGDGGTSKAEIKTINLTADNDDPSNTGGLPSDIMVTEDTPSSVNLSIMNLEDPDADAGSLTLTLVSSAGGVLTASSGGGVTISGSGTASLTLSGALGVLNAFVDAPSKLQYLGALHANGDNADSLSLNVTDNGHTGDDGGGSIGLGSVNIDIAPVGDTPQVSNLTTDEDTQSGPIALDRHAADGPEVTHFRLSNITNGALYQNDGVTPINNGDYILVAEGQAGLRFTPTPNSIAPGSFDVESSEDGTTVSAQSGIATSTITVTPTNDAPVLDNTGDMTLTDVTQDNTNSPGNAVSAIIASAAGDRITDADSGALEGIAVIGVDDTNGAWEYSTDGGAIWHSFVTNGVANGATDDTSAVLLDEAALIRFVPNPSYAGSAGDITFHAWDQTAGSDGDAGVNASVQGGTNPYSLDAETATLSVIDLPDVINLVPGVQDTDEDIALTFSTGNGNSISVDDGTAADPLLLTSLSVTNGTLTLATTAGLTFESGADGTSVMTVSGLEGAINAALDGLEYTPTGDYHGPETLQVMTDALGGLIAHYTFDNPVNPGNDDGPGGANDGTIIGGATTIFDATRDSDVLELDGTNDYVFIPGRLGEPQNLTLAAWVNLDSGFSSKNDELISLGDNVSVRLDMNFIIDLGVSGLYHAGFLSYRNSHSGTEIAGTGWHHVVYTVDTTDDEQVVYIDGTPVETDNHTASIVYSNGNNTYIGRHGSLSTGFLHGKVDDARIYDRALTAVEVADLFAGNLGGGSSDTDYIAITVNPIADTPSVTGTSTLEDTQSTSGLAVSRHPADGPEVTHFKITGISGGSLYQNDGVTPINSNDFITFIQGSTGLKFTPAANSNANGNFTVQASTSSNDSGLGGNTVDATITVTPVADTPSVTNASTDEDTQTTSGLVISLHPDDGVEVTHFKITAISDGTLFQNDGTTPISDGGFILVAQGNAGLRFTPATNVSTDGSFTVQASLSNMDAGLGGSTVDATITVTAVNDDPSAHAGGPYDIDEGEAVTLDASLSTDIDNAALTYSWDLDGNDSFDDATGVAPNLSWAQLQSFGINDGDQSYPIKVRVEDGGGGSNDALATINVTNVAPDMMTSGASTVTAGQPYTLNLSANDPGADAITGWVINWGDGMIETVIGNPSSRTHTYSQAGFTYNILASATDDDGTFIQNDLLVPSYTRDSIFLFKATTGAFLEEFANAEGLDDPIEAIIGPDGDLYVSGETSDNILRYDPATETFVGVFVAQGSGGLDEPGGMVFGPDGNLYVANGLGDEVRRYNAADGTFIDAFVTLGSGGLDQPYGLAFGPDGHLYVGSYSNHEVLRYDGANGAFLGTFVSPGSGGLDTPGQVVFGPDGNLYIASFETDNILRYDGTTGAFIDMFVTTGLGGLDQPTGLAFGPDGHLYVSDFNNSRILRYNGNTGAFIDTYVNAGSGGLASPVFTTFLTHHQVMVQPNIPPTINLTGGNVAYTENDPPVSFDATAIVSDPDSPDFDTGTLTVNFTVGGTVNDRLNIQDQGPGAGNISIAGIDVRYDFGGGPVKIGVFAGGTSGADPLSITFNTNATATAVEAALRNITYQNVSDAPSTTTRTVQFILTDGDGGTSDADTKTIDLTDDNDDPSNIGALPSDIMVIEDELNNVPLMLIDLVDLDAGAESLTLTLVTSAGGSLIASNSGGVAVSGSGTVTLTLTGTVGALNAFIDDTTKIQYLSVPNTHGDNADSLFATVTDNGNTGSGGGGNIVLGTINIDIAPVGDTPQVANISTDEDTQSGPIALDRHSADGPEVTHFKITNITNGSLFQSDGLTPINSGDYILVTEGQAGLKFTPVPDSNTPGTFDVESSEDGTSVALQSGVATATITVNSVADTPSVTNASTLEDTQTTSGLVISIHPADGPEVTHVKITAITGGILYQNDGTTPISNGDFITSVQGNVGLKFTPTPNSMVSGSFTVQASTASNNTGLGGGTVNATITVAPVADTPAATHASTLEDAQTTSGLVISLNPVDGPEVTHFKITAITGGTLFLNDGVTVISNGNFITTANGNAGLRFTPEANANTNGSFIIQASTTSHDAGLGGSAINATISITPVGDTPQAASITTDEDTQSDPITIDRHVADGPEVTHFRISNIINGNLFQNDGITPIGHNDYILVAQGQAGLRFTPDLHSTAPGSFDVESSENGTSVAAQSGIATSTITITPINDDPVITLPGSAITYGEGDPPTLIAPSATLSDPEASDFDSGVLTVDITAGATTNDRLVIRDQGPGIGNIRLSGSDVQFDFGTGPVVIGTFSGGGGLADPLLVNLNANANQDAIQALLRNLTYENVATIPSQANRVIAFSLNDGNGGSSPPVNQIVIFNVTTSLWLTTQDDTIPSDTNLSEWKRGDVVGFGDAATFGETATSGNFSLLFALFLNDASQADLRGIHYVTQSLTLGSGANTFDVQPGDLIAALDIAGTLLSSNSLSVTPNDIFLFRPDAPGNYATGTFTMVLDNPVSANIQALSLVEQDVTWPDGTNLTAGTFLLAHSGPHENVHTFEPTGVGPGAATSGATQLLLDGSLLGFNQPIHGLELIESETTIGDTTIPDDQLLMSINGNTTVAGQAVTPQDIVSLRVTGTERGTGTAATATLLFDGDNVNLSDTDETLDGFTVARNNPLAANTPSVTDTSTLEDTQTTAGLVISRHVDDGPEVSHFKITNITGGTLFENDGTTPIVNDDFIAFATGNAGLKFTPDANATADGHVTVQASTAANNGGLGGGTVDATITITPVGDTPSVTNAVTKEDTQTGAGLVISRHLDDGNEVSHFKITNIANGTLYQNDGTTPIINGSYIPVAEGQVGLRFTPDPDSIAPGSFDVESSEDGTNVAAQSNVATATITVTPVADTPSVTHASTLEDTQTTSGLVIPLNPVDGPEVTHFKITAITGGVLYQNDGLTSIGDDDFITVAQGNNGLRFTPVANSITNGSFAVQAATASNDTGLGGSTVTAIIVVAPVADTPSVTNASTFEDNQTASGLVISRNLADGAEVTHVKITAITGGSLYQNDGATPINNGDFITVSEGNAGLKFTPTANSNANGNFTVQAATSNNNVGLGGSTVLATITITPVGDTPEAASLNTGEDMQSGPILLERHRDDGAEVTHFRISNIANGTLFQNDGMTPINDGDYILVAEGQAGLTFTPAPNSILPGSFDVEASENGTSVAAQSNRATATITVTPINDAPVLDNTGVMTLTDVIQDSTNPPGNSVAAIISSASGDRITDADSGALEGIAIIGIDDTNGTWEYSTDSGVNWRSFVASGVANALLDDRSAVLIDSAAHIRFIPNPGYTGTAGNITFYAWDQTFGASGDTGVDASAQGGATPYSADTETATLSVIAVLGVTNLVPGAQTTDEDTALIFSAGNGNPLTVTDGAGTDLPLRTSLSVTNGTLTLATTGSLIFESGANGTPAMVISGLETTINAALDGLDYTPTGNYHGPANLHLTTDDAVGLTAQYTFGNPVEPGHDDSPNAAHDGTLIGSPIPIFDPVRGSDALRFDGVDDHVHIPGLLGNPQQVTVAAWVDMDAGFTSEALISIGGNIGIRLDETLTGVHGFFHDGSASQPTVSNVFIAGTGWHHIAYTVDTTSQAQVLYIDGTAVTSDNHNGAIVYSQGADTFIGRHGVSAADFFHGVADEVRVYNRALSAAEVSNLFSERTADTDVISITVNPVNDAPVLSSATPSLTPIMEDDTSNVGDLIASILGTSVTDVDTGAAEGIAITGLSGGMGNWAYSTNGGGSWIPIGSVSGNNARLLAADASTRIRFEPNPNAYGTVLPGVTFRAWDRTTGANGGTANTTANGDSTAFSSNTNTAAIVVNAVGDTPQAANASTLEDTQSGPIALDRHSDDGTEVAYFRISNIANGTLFQNDGVTPIGNGDFILVAEGQAGLRFTPTPNSISTGGFDVEASENGSSVSVQSDVARAVIAVAPVADTPVVTHAATTEDNQTTSGLVISRNPVDGLEVTHFKITAISGGILYQNDGTTPIGNSDFITVAQGSAGLRFAPALNSTADGSFTVQASIADHDAGLGGDPSQAIITVTAINNDPTAHAGGPYEIDEGSSVTLDASASTDIDSATLTYAWELDGNNSFDDATGVSPALTWAQLQSFGIDDGDRSYLIEVRVDDGDGGSHTASTAINVTNTIPTLITTGAANVTVGLPYTLNLSANDPGDDGIESWVINWGDGAIETIFGNPSSVTHIYQVAGFTHNILASAADEDGVFLQNELVIPSFTTDKLFRFEATTGDFVQAFATADGLDDPIEVIAGPDGNLYVSGETSDDILRYDASTGVFVDIFVTAGSGGLDEPGGMAFGPDGHLYVANGLGDGVLRYDGNTGAFIDAFVTPGSGGLDQPYSLTFGPDGHLYVASFTTHEVLRYDGQTGTFIGQFVSPGSGALDTPEQMTFGPDGNLYITSFATNNVLRYDGGTGAFIDAFVTAGLGGLTQPTGLVFGPDGNLYVGDFANGLIRRYDGNTGAFIDDYVDAGSGGLATPGLMTFLPAQQINISANLPPTLSISGDSTTYTENSPPVRLDVTSTISDPDSPDFDTGVLLIDFAAGGTANDRLDIHDQGPGVGQITTSGINVQYDFGSGPLAIGTFVGGVSGSNPLNIVFNANADTTSVEAVLRHIAFHNVSDDPSTAPRTIRLIITDGDGGTSAAVTKIVNLIAENDDPSNTGALPSDVIVTEDQASDIDLSTIDLADADAGTGNLTLTLTTNTESTLIASSQGGVAVSGSGTTTLTLTGTVGALNAFIDDTAAIQYLSASNTNGNDADRLSLDVSDNGNTNSNSDTRIALGSINIDIAPVGNTPSVTNTSTLEDTPTAVPLLILPHPDDGPEITHFKITDITGGTLFLTNNATLVREGDFITLDQGAAGLIFVPAADSNIDGNFNVQASTVADDGGLGNGMATATIVVHAVNDAPVATITSAYTVNENTPLALHATGLLVSDPDPGTDAAPVQVTLSASEGTLAVAAGTTGVTVTNSDSNRTLLNHVTLDGTLTQINSLLSGALGAVITYTAIDAPTPNATLTLSINDLGNGGSGGNLSATASAPLTIIAENDRPTSLSLTQNTVVEATDSRNGHAIGTLSTTDPDGDDIATYRIIGGTDEALFTIGAANALILTDGILDFETRPTYLVTVRVTDSGGATQDQTFAIAVADIATTITAGQQFSVAETAAGLFPVGAIATTGDTPTRFTITSGNEDAPFVIDANGLLSLSKNALLDFETTPSYALSIDVSDGTSTASETVIVEVTDVTEATATTDNGSSFTPLTTPSSGTGVSATGTTGSASSPASPAPAPSPSSDQTPVEEAAPEDNTAPTSAVVQNSPSTPTAPQSTRPPPSSPAPPAPSPRPSNDSPCRTINRPVSTSTSQQGSRSSGRSSSSSVSRAPVATSKPITSAAPTQSQTEPVISTSSPEIDGVTTPSISQLSSLAKSIESIDFQQELDKLRDDVHQDEEVAQAVRAGAAALTTSLSIGYVLWLLRGGILLSSLLTSLPAWRYIDPLPVLMHSESTRQTDTTGDDSLEAMIQQGEDVKEIDP